MANKPKKYQKEYETFIKEQHICKCGCGTVLKPSYKSFVAAIAKHNIPPRYVYQHCQRKINMRRYKKIPDMIEYNGCKIVLLKNGKRCKKGYKCEKYLDCLNHIAVLGAKGWETITV